MFAKVSKLLAAGAMMLATGQVQAAEYYGSSWSNRPGYIANDSRSSYAGYRGGLNGTNGIAVGGCYGKGCTNGSCTNCSNGACNPRPYDNTWSQSRWNDSRWNDSQWNGNRWNDRSVNTLPYRNPSYLPVSRPTTSTWNVDAPFRHNLPGYGRSSWNDDRPYFR